MIGAMTLIIWSALTLRIPFVPSGGQLIVARLASVADARVGQPVRINGVNVGEITGVAPGPHDTGVLTLQVDSGIPIHADARIDLRWRTFFGGNMAVALDPGSPTAPRLKGPIPLTATHTQVEFDQLLQPLTVHGRTAVRQTLIQGSIALEHPDAPRADAALLQPTLRGATTAVTALGGTQAGDLAALVRATGSATAALATSEQNLASFIDSAQITLGVTAARHEVIAQLLSESPGSLAQTTTTMQRLRGTLDQLDPLVADVKPAAPLVAPAVAAAEPALSTLGNSLNRLRPALESVANALAALHTLASVAGPVLRQLTPSLQRLQDKIIPALDQVQPSNRLKLYEAIGPWFAAATSSVSEFDANGHMVRFQVNGGEGTLNPTDCQLTTLPSNSACAILATLIDKLTGALP